MDFAALCRDGIGLFLIVGALTKALDLRDSVAALSIHVSFRRARLIVPCLSAYEAGLGLVIVSGLYPTVSLVLAAVTFAGFSIVQAVWVRHDHGAVRSCGCFGFGIPSVVSWFSVSRNIVVAALAALLAATDPHRGILAGLSLSEWAGLLPAAASFTLLMINVSALDALYAKRRRGQVGQGA